RVGYCMRVVRNTEHEWRNDEGWQARSARRHFVECADALADARELHADFLFGFAECCCVEISVGGVAPTPGEGHMPRPWIPLMFGTFDEEDFQLFFGAD